MTLIQSLLLHEGLRLKAYPDPESPLAKACREAGIKAENFKNLSGWSSLSGAPWTIGVGHTDSHIDANTQWTQQQAMDQLNVDIRRAHFLLDAKLPWWNTQTPARQDALTELTFNMGINGLLQFKKMLAALQAKDWEAAAEELLASAWDKQVGPDRAGYIAGLLRQG